MEVFVVDLVQVYTTARLVPFRSSLKGSRGIVLVVLAHQLPLASHLARTHLPLAVQTIANAARQGLLSLSLA